MTYATPLRALVALALALPLVAVSPAAAESRRSDTAIVFFSDRGSPAADQAVDSLFLIEPATGRVSRLTDDPTVVDRWPALSPDGREVAWVRIPVIGPGDLDPSRSAIYRCRLVRERAGIGCSTPMRVIGPVLENAITWTPDSRSILYTGYPTSEDLDLYVVDRLGGSPRNLTAEPADGVAVTSNQPAVSPDGRWVYYSRGYAPVGADLYRRPLRGGAAQQLTAAPLNDVGVDVSPDGRRLVFHSNRDPRDNTTGVDFDIYTMRAEPESATNPAIDLTDALRGPTGSPSQERRPTYSPDGRRVAFWWFTDPPSGPSAGFTDSEIYSIRPDGSGLRNLTSNNPAPGETPGTPLYSDLQPDWGRLRPAR